MNIVIVDLQMDGTSRFVAYDQFVSQALTPGEVPVVAERRRAKGRAAGNSIAEAIGNLVLKNGEELGVCVTVASERP